MIEKLWFTSNVVAFIIPLSMSLVMFFAMHNINYDIVGRRLALVFTIVLIVFSMVTVNLVWVRIYPVFV